MGPKLLSHRLDGDDDTFLFRKLVVVYVYMKECERHNDKNQKLVWNTIQTLLLYTNAHKHTHYTFKGAHTSDHQMGTYHV